MNLRTSQWPHDEIRNGCQRWQVAELSVFGSVLREDLGADSDLDLLVSFKPGARWSLLEDSAIACRWIIQFAADVATLAFYEDKKTQPAILHQQLLIGEAVKRLSPAIRDRATAPASALSRLQHHIHRRG